MYGPIAILTSMLLTLMPLAACAAGEGGGGAVSEQRRAASSDEAAAGSSVAETTPDDAEGRKAAPSAAVAWLDRLEAAGRDLEGFRARVIYTREQPLLGDRQVRIGRLAYQPAERRSTEDAETDDGADADGADGSDAIGNDDDAEGGNADGRPAKFAIRFTHLQVGQGLRERPQYYIFDGQWLAEIHPDRRQFIKRQVVPPGRRYDPLKLGEGPFPLPLGQRRQQVLELFEVELVRAEEDPADAVHLAFTPRAEQAERLDYRRIDLWYDRQTLLPRRVRAEEPSGDLTIVQLKDPQVGPIGSDEAAELFSTETPPAGSGWRVEVKPWSE